MRDLSRLERGLSARSGSLCLAGPGAMRTRKQVLDALRYILDDNWALHNFVEQSLFIPWARGKKPVEPVLGRHVRLVAEERERLQMEANVLTNAVEKWVDVGRARCRGELGGIKERVRRLRENAATLFAASEAVFVPRVVNMFDEKEQVQFNNSVLKNITGRQARISLVIFGDAVQQDDPVVATRTDRDDFENDIPAPIRKLAMPYWKNKFVGQRTRFIAGQGSPKR